MANNVRIPYNMLRESSQKKYKTEIIDIVFLSDFSAKVMPTQQE